ncbi:MAG: right-handed parallel beta-helix repeat-containing protein, partial [Archangium sp.]
MRTLRPWLLIFAACSPLTPRLPVETPVGLTCTRLTVPSGTLEEALAAAEPGDCVILPAGTYQGSFVLPEDVSIAASAGAEVTLTGGDPVLSIVGGKRSVVQGLKILAGEGGGIAIEPGPAQLIGVKVSQAKEEALVATCTREDCDEREVTITDSELTQSSVGLRVKGAKVKVSGGRIAEQLGTSLSAGSGIVATGGAKVQLDNVTVEDNQNVGVLIDGAATRASLTGCNVKHNLGRGLWVQGQTADAGEVTVDVNGGEFADNALVGIGARDTVGLRVLNAAVKSTTIVRVPVDISRTEEVGDGVGLFTGARAITLQGVTLENNARAQLLADQVGSDVRVVSTSFTGGRFRAVVQ